MKHSKHLNAAQAPILTLGGTGKTGRRVTSKLQQLGVPVRVGSRSAKIRFDWQIPKTWRPVLEGVKKVYTAFHPDLAIPEAASAIRSLADTALSCGVEHMVLLSGRGEEGALAAENELRDSGLDWTIVRASWFSQNFSEGFLVDQVRSGRVTLPAGDVGEPFVDADDIADIAVAALTEDAHRNQVYEATGSRLLTFADAARAISDASARRVDYVQISAEAFVAGLEQHGIASEAVQLLSFLFDEVLDGRNENLADGVQSALGRQPQDFADYAKRTAATGVWQRQEARR